MAAALKLVPNHVHAARLLYLHVPLHLVGVRQRVGVRVEVQLGAGGRHLVPRLKHLLLPLLDGGAVEVGGQHGAQAGCYGGCQACAPRSHVFRGHAQRRACDGRGRDVGAHARGARVKDDALDLLQQVPAHDHVLHLVHPPPHGARVDEAARAEDVVDGGHVGVLDVHASDTVDVAARHHHAAPPDQRHGHRGAQHQHLVVPAAQPQVGILLKVPLLGAHPPNDHHTARHRCDDHWWHIISRREAGGARLAAAAAAFTA
mmetsp:Transcript_22377/g.56949  ORF Transcript_22377/g.56949 Transcript_22377/m.56949 type:complete len:259 (-) Transcript_22377:232-1008(-)